MTIDMVLKGKGAEVVTVAGEATMADAVAQMASRRIGSLVVVDSAGAIVGIISERDLIQCLAVHGESSLSRPVEHAMTRDVVVAGRDTPILSALGLMSNRRIRHLPILEDGQLAGIVSIGDLVQHRLRRIEAEAQAMREYIQAS